MWYFSGPQIYFGEDALDYLLEIKGKKAFIVTDETMLQQCFVQQVRQRLSSAGLESTCYTRVEPDPSLENVRQCASQMMRLWSGLGHRTGGWLLPGCCQSRLVFIRTSRRKPGRYQPDREFWSAGQSPADHHPYYGWRGG